MTSKSRICAVLWLPCEVIASRLVQRLQHFDLTILTDFLILQHEKHSQLKTIFLKLVYTQLSNGKFEASYLTNLLAISEATVAEAWDSISSL